MFYKKNDYNEHNLLLQLVWITDSPVRDAGGVVRMHDSAVSERVDVSGVCETLARMYHLVILLQITQSVQFQSQLFQFQPSSYLHSRSLLQQPAQ